MRTPIKIGKLASLLMLAMVLSPSAQASSISAEARPNPLPEDESLLLRIEVQVEGTGGIEKPEFSAPDFDIVGQSNSIEASSQFINGKFTYARRHQYSFVLFPKKSGNLPIKDIVVKAGQEELRAQDISVYVRGASQSTQNTQPNATAGNTNNNPPPSSLTPSQLGKEGNHPKDMNSDFTVHINANKRAAYVGEPVVVEYYLYDNNNIVSADIKKWPTFNGFWKEDIELASRIEFQPVWVGNNQMRRALIARYALYPIRPGKIRVDQLAISGTYLWRKRQMDDNDPFGMFFGRAETRSAVHSSRELIIDVLPLPQEGRPTKFSGAVGKFQISTSVDKNSVAVGAPLNLKTEISGSGNFQAIDEVKVNLPPDFEIYESNSSGKSGNNPGGENKRSFNTLILPRKPGKYTIPPVEWNYFDPESKRYIQVTTQPIAIDVTGEASANTGMPAAPNAASISPVAAPNVTTKFELRYLKPAEEAIKTSSPFLKNIWWLVSLLLLSGLFLSLVFKQKNIFSTLKKYVNTMRLPQKKIQHAISILQKDFSSRSAFFASLHESIHLVLEHYLQTSATGLTREEISSLWRSKGLPATTYHQVEKILERCDTERFSSQNKNALSKEEKAHFQDEVKKIIREAKIRTK